jgi:hypothetical protein
MGPSSFDCAGKREEREREKERELERERQGKVDALKTLSCKVVKRLVPLLRVTVWTNFK